VRIARFSGYPDHLFGRLVAAIVMAAPVAVLSAGGAFADATSTSLSSTPDRSVYGQSVKFSATVYGNGPTGAVAFMDGSNNLGSAAPGIVGVGATIEGGLYHSCAVTAAGAARCWGDNAVGQLGDGTMVDRTTPVPVTGLSSNIVAVAAGSFHSCALTIAGAVVCWGSNVWGQLGDGTTTSATTPVAVTGLSSGVVAIEAGRYFTCAITRSGAARCWGRNDSGQLGNGTTADSTVPVPVSELVSDVAGMALGNDHACAVTGAGAVSCWGSNSDGQLGDGTTTDSLVPVPVTGLASGATDIAAGRQHSCAVAAGAVRCWGLNDYGQLGNGTTTDSAVPVPVTGLSSGGASVVAGSYHSCAVTQAGAVSCWGDNSFGALGDGSIIDSTTPVPVAGLTSIGAIVAAGWYHSCVVTNTGIAACWGGNGEGQLGDSSTTDRVVPVGVSGLVNADSVLLPARAVFSTAALPAGTHAMTARYGGDSDNDASISSPLSLKVKKGKTKIKAIKVKPRKPSAGALARVKLKVKAKEPAIGMPKGKVVIKDGKKKLGKFKVKKGKAMFKTTFATAGKHKLKAAFRGKKNWKKSKGTKNFRVR
jgi:alpha-tubulin suppressor-like RCC1 family protein